MATVLVGAYGADPSTIWPEKYSSCFWNFVTGWTCQTVDAPAPLPPPPNGNGGGIQQPLGNTPDPNASPMLPVLASGPGGTGCGCCGGGGMAPVAGSPLPGVSPAIPTATGAKQCGQCGYTNREALLAVAVAFAFFLLTRSK